MFWRTILIILNWLTFNLWITVANDTDEFLPWYIVWKYLNPLKIHSFCKIIITILFVIITAPIMLMTDLFILFIIIELVILLRKEKE